MDMEEVELGDSPFAAQANAKLEQKKMKSVQDQLLKKKKLELFRQIWTKLDSILDFFIIILAPMLLVVFGNDLWGKYIIKYNLEGIIWS